MASVLSNTIFRFSLQPSSEASKGFLHLKSQTLHPPNSRPPATKSTKIRADTGYEFGTLNSDDQLQKFLKRDYKYGFSEEIESFTIPKGLSEETIRLISSRKNEPDWMLEFRLSSYKKFLKMTEPKWADNRYPPIDFTGMCYYSEPIKKPVVDSLDEADPELIKYFEKFGIPLNERNRLANVAVDAVLDSVSIATTHRKTLEAAGVIFFSISETVREYLELVRKYLGRVLPSDDN